MTSWGVGGLKPRPANMDRAIRLVRHDVDGASFMDGSSARLDGRVEGPGPSHDGVGKCASSVLRSLCYISGTGTDFCAQAARTVLCSRQAIVIGPTPPGTGVIAPATSAQEA